MKSVTFYPIGKVKIENGRFFIELEEKYAQALKGIEEYSHIQVVWWFHLYDNDETRNYLVMDKPYAKGPEKVGVLASRSPVRPNPIGITACQLIRQESSTRLEVAYIDAENDTPVLDIKPYEPSIDRVREVTMPKWCKHWPQYLEDNESFDWGKEFSKQQ
jgi:putative methyltransferase, YaeB/AF_0241 family